MTTIEVVFVAVLFLNAMVVALWKRAPVASPPAPTPTPEPLACINALNSVVLQLLETNSEMMGRLNAQHERGMEYERLRMETVISEAMASRAVPPPLPRTEPRRDDDAIVANFGPVPSSHLG